MPGAGELCDVALVPHGVLQLEQGWVVWGKVHTPKCQEPEAMWRGTFIASRRSHATTGVWEFGTRSVLPHLGPCVVETTERFVPHFAGTTAELDHLDDGTGAGIDLVLAVTSREACKQDFKASLCGTCRCGQRARQGG